ncbi:MAG: hypothetical protein JXA66_04215 [Oligoflexia bacterium]|nr:hypothetical protein [Oligoflexia bacterium]
MKNLFIAAISLGMLITGAFANTTKEAPYRIECYSKYGKRVKCSTLDKYKMSSYNEFGERKVSKRSRYSKNRSKKYYSKKTNKKSKSIAKSKSDERAKLLAELNKEKDLENEKLKAELEQLRKSNLIAAAQNTEQSTDAKLAAPTSSATPVPTASTEIAADVEEKEETSPLSANIWNAIERGFKDNEEPLSNAFGINIKYQATEHVAFETEPKITWKWTNNTEGSTVTFDDLGFKFSYANLYLSPDTDSNINGSVTLTLPTSSGSRDAGNILTMGFNLDGETKVNDKKGALKMGLEFNLPITRYSTGNPSVTSIDGLNSDNQWQAPDGTLFEKLAPGTKYKFGIGFGFSHELGPKLVFEIGTKFTSSKMYADDLYVENVFVDTITEETWKHEFELVFPKLIAKLTDKLSIESFMKSNGTVEGFRPFSTTDNNVLTWGLRISYAI